MWNMCIGDGKDHFAAEFYPGGSTLETKYGFYQSPDDAKQDFECPFNESERVTHDLVLLSLKGHVLL